MDHTDPVRSNPRRFSIRLPRPLWIGLVAGLFAIGAVGLRMGVPVYRQYVAIREIEALGGKVQTRECGPNWLRRSVGNDWMKMFDTASVVELYGTRASDATMAQIGWLEHMQWLNVSNTQVTDNGLLHLKRLTSLQELGLNNTRVADLESLPALTKLRVLGLNNTRVSDTGLSNLGKLTNLERLSLRNTALTDAGLSQLRGLTSLNELYLDNPQVTDAGIAQLSELRNLEVLLLKNTQVTKSGVTDLKRALPGATIYCLYRAADAK